MIMVKGQIQQPTDLDIRHFVYAFFAETTRPATSGNVADHFKVSIADVEAAFERLAAAHHIALAPGSFSIWMAHPFSGVSTNFIAEVGGKKYWGN